MWSGVTKRFNTFASNLKLTSDQVEDGKTKYHGITKCLNEHYCSLGSEDSNILLVGSWGKHTRMRPPRDVDLLFKLPKAVYDRFQTYSGNKQSALLQEVKGVVAKKYSSTEMRADGQVIVVRFNTINVEVLPAFELTNGQFWICDTNNGGKYKDTDPIAEQQNMRDANSASNGNARLLTKYMKCWQRECTVPIKSFWLELLAIEFLEQWKFKLESAFYHDWMTRDFFSYLVAKRHSHVIVPGAFEYISLGDEWFSRAESARDRATKAERYEYADQLEEAGEEWQKIFGSPVPKHI